MVHVAAPEENQARFQLLFLGNEGHVASSCLFRSVQFPCRLFLQAVDSSWLCRLCMEHYRKLCALFLVIYDIVLILSDDLFKLGLVLLFPSRPRFGVQHACRLRLPHPLPRVELYGLGGRKLSWFAFGHGPPLALPSPQGRVWSRSTLQGKSRRPWKSGIFSSRPLNCAATT